MLEKHFKNPVCDDQMSEIALMNTVIVNEPGSFTAGADEVDIQTLLLTSDFRYRSVERLEEVQVGMLPDFSAGHEISHKVRAWQHNQWLDLLADTLYNSRQFLLKQ